VIAGDQGAPAIAGRDRTLGCVITIGAWLVEAGHARRTDVGRLGFRIGELSGKETDRMRELVTVMSDVAGAKVTTNLMGERRARRRRPGGRRGPRRRPPPPPQPAASKEVGALWRNDGGRGLPGTCFGISDSRWRRPTT
jgi:hypothetical protein